MKCIELYDTQAIPNLIIQFPCEGGGPTAFGMFHRQDLTVSGHGDSCAALESIFALPKNGGSLRVNESSLVPPQRNEPRTHLILSVEVDTAPSVERNIAKGTGLIPTPREHGQRHGNRNVNSNLSHINLPFVFPSSGARLGKDGGSVTILVLVDDLEGLIESVGVEDDKNGSEDLFMVAFHCGVGFDDGRPDEVSVWVSFYRDLTSIQNDLSAFRLGGANKSKDTRFGSGRDDGTPAHTRMSNVRVKRKRAHRSVLGSKPPLTLSFEARSMRPGRKSLASPTRTATEIAMHR